MPIITPAYFEFFDDLAKNNDSPWFQANKKRYEKDVKEPFLQLIGEIIHQLQNSTEPDLIVDPKRCLFRINRDIRFSADKRPYKEHLAASISKFGTKDKLYPGHYIHLGNDQLMIAGGAYFFEEKEMLARVRHYIADHEGEFKGLMEEPAFKEAFGEIKGEQNKRLTPELEEARQKQPLIANKQFYWSIELDKTEALKEDFAKYLVRVMKITKPLQDFLIAAMYG